MAWKNTEANRDWLKGLSQSDFDRLSPVQRKKAKRLHRENPDLNLLSHLDIGEIRISQRNIQSSMVNPTIRKQIIRPILRVVDKKIEEVIENFEEAI